MRQSARYKIAQAINALLMQLEKDKGLTVDEQYSVKDTRKAVDQLLWDTKPFSVRLKEGR